MISKSKIKKITVIKKNRKENVARILCSGSNPHSKLLFFSRFLILLFFNNKDRVFNKIIIIIKSIKIKKILLFLENLLIGNQVYFLY